MTTGLNDMDKELLQLVSETAGRAAAQEIIVELRAEISEQFEGMKREITTGFENKFTTYFGKQQPSEHLISHDRLDRGLRWYDGLMEKMWTKVLFGVLSASTLVAAISWGIAKGIGH